MSTTIPALHLEELRDRAVRDISELTPGTEVIFAHVPDLLNAWSRSSPDSAYGTIGTITEVGMKYYDETHPGQDRLKDEEPSLVIFYSKGGDRLHHIHAADTGVIPYGDPGHEFYNPINFVVLLAPLEAEGIVPLLSASEDFEEQLKRYNSQISTDGRSASPWRSGW